MTIGAEISRLIEAKYGPRSQKRAADEMGISTAYLSDVVNGNRGISAEVAIRISRVFGHGVGEDLYLRQSEAALAAAKAAALAAKKKQRVPG